MQPLLAYFMPGYIEVIIVGLVVLLLFGNRLPAVMRSMGRSVVEFKKGVNEIEEDADDGMAVANRTKETDE